MQFEQSAWRVAGCRARIRALSGKHKLQRPSRLLDKYLEEHPHEGNALVRLFGTADACLKHFKGTLERRITQVVSIDPTLKWYLERGTEGLPDHPGVFLANVRGIVNQAFEMIWKAELGSKTIPSEWMSIWTYNNERGVDDWQIPQQRVAANATKSRRSRILGCLSRLLMGLIYEA